MSKFPTPLIRWANSWSIIVDLFVQAPRGPYPVVDWWWVFVPYTTWFVSPWWGLPRYTVVICMQLWNIKCKCFNWFGCDFKSYLCSSLFHVSFVWLWRNITLFCIFDDDFFWTKDRLVDVTQVLCRCYTSWVRKEKSVANILKGGKIQK